MTDKHKLCKINVIEAFFINLLIYTNQIRPEALTTCNILQTLQQKVCVLIAVLCMRGSSGAVAAAAGLGRRSAARVSRRSDVLEE